MPSRIGIGSWTFPWAVGVPGYPPSLPLTAAALLAKAVELGAGVVQIADNLPLTGWTNCELASLRALAESSSLVLEVGTRGVEPALLGRYLAIARAVGAPLVRTVDSHPDLGQVEAWLREVLPEFAAAGVSIGLENHEWHTAAELCGLVERVGSRSLGICLDTVNSFGALEGMEHVIATLAPYAINVHVKDFRVERIDTKMGYLVSGCPAGEGRLDIPALWERMERYGRKPNLILEQWPPFAGSVENTIALEAEWAARGMRYLRQCAGARPQA